MQGREPGVGVEVAVGVVAILENAPDEFLGGKGVGGGSALHHGGLNGAGGTRNQRGFGVAAVAGAEEAREV